MLQSERKWAMSCYIPVLNIIICPLCSIRKANNDYCLFHSRQGLVLFGLWFVTILMALISQTLSLMMWGIVLLLHASGVFIAYKNSINKIPLIGEIAEAIPKYYLFELLTGKKYEKNVGEETKQQEK